MQIEARLAALSREQDRAELRLAVAGQSVRAAEAHVAEMGATIHRETPPVDAEPQEDPYATMWTHREDLTFEERMAHVARLTARAEALLELAEAEAA